MSAPQPSWSFSEKVRRIIWYICYRVLFRCTFHNWYGFRAAILRCFGAKLGRGVRIRRTAWIEIPWHLDLAEDVIVGGNPAKVIKRREPIAL